MSLSQPAETVIAFGRYRLWPDPPRLEADGEVVELGARAFAVLLALVEAAGRPLDRAELARHGWPHLEVDPNTVQVQISLLRRALGDDRDLIVTVPGCGYRLALAPRTESRNPTPEPATVTGTGPGPRSLIETPMPFQATPTVVTASRGGPDAARQTPFIGRHAELSELLGLASPRVITLVGKVGVGKARLAREAASRLAAQFPDGVVQVELSALTPDDALADAFSLALHLPPASGRSAAQSLLDHLRARRLLLTVNCSDRHRVPMTHLVDALIAAAPGLRMIVTATASLSARGERIVPLGPLRVPEHRDVDPALAPQFDALRLLFARLALSTGRKPDERAQPRGLFGATLLTAFNAGQLPQAAVDAAVRIAQRLDGVPLALELAAVAIAHGMRADASPDAYLDSYSDAYADSYLDSSVDVPPHAFPTAALDAFARRLDALHASRVATCGVPHSRASPIAMALDLHVATLDARLRRQFMRLAMFAGAFPRCAAVRLLADCEPSLPVGEGGEIRREANADDRLDQLVEAGLIDELDSDGQWMLRMRDSVRTLARDALSQAGEFERTAAAHAAALPPRLDAHRQRGARRDGDVLDRTDLDDVRAALDWALSADRFEPTIAILEASEFLWGMLSRDDEYVLTLRSLLARLGAGPMQRVRDRMRANAMLARTLQRTGIDTGEAIRVWDEVYELANACADRAYREHALVGLIACFAATAMASYRIDAAGGALLSFE